MPVMALFSDTSTKANILIDQNGHARIADFGFTTIALDSANPMASSSGTNAGTVRWMSPELLCSELSDSKEARPTKASDCYALGMVILEVFSGEIPFARHSHFIVLYKVGKGEPPERPAGTWTTDNLWTTLKRCWSLHPKDRPTAEVILETLGQEKWEEEKV